jgi:putative ABC transport system permease protein
MDGSGGGNKMNFLDLTGYAFHHLRHRGLRTWLTLLGIVVGISSVILLVGLVDGLSSDVSEKLGELGSDIITIMPGGTAGRGGPPGMGGDTSSAADKLYMEDVDTVRGVQGVETVSPTISVTVDVEYRDRTEEMTVTGVDTETYMETNTLSDLSEGRYLESGDRGVVLVSNSVVERTFNGKVKVNSKISLDGKAYRIVGILEEDDAGMGGGMGGGGRIYIPIDDARELGADDLADEEVTRIQAKIGSAYNLSKVTEDITWALQKDHGVTDEDQDFMVMSPTFMEEMTEEILSTLTIFLALVSAISLIVGGIGISNTMFMSVLERTREIGVLKALGATSSQIRDIFLMESAMIGLSGGILGIAAGWLFIQIAGSFGFSGFVSIFMAVLSFTVSVGIGVIAGTYPAAQATRIPAVEALRYE